MTDKTLGAYQRHEKTITDRVGDVLTLSTGHPSARTDEVTVHVREHFRGRTNSAAVHVTPRDLRAALDEFDPVRECPDLDAHWRLDEAMDRAERAERERDEARERAAERDADDDLLTIARAQRDEARRERDVLRQERDDARRHECSDLDAHWRLDEALASLKEANATVASLRAAEQHRTLTPDDISDEMVRRGAQVATPAGVRYLRPHEVLEVLTAALTEPARPEGAADWDDVIADQVAGDLAPEAIQKLADTIAIKSAENGA